MKKLLAIALIATSFVACNDSETKTDEKTTSDTTAVVVPQPADTVKTVVDTTVKTTTTVVPGKDTTKK
ncbi:MAG: hypothetical protein ABI741_03775 [Ferruginibacter sp.]